MIYDNLMMSTSFLSARSANDWADQTVGTEHASAFCLARLCVRKGFSALKSLPARPQCQRTISSPNITPEPGASDSCGSAGNGLLAVKGHSTSSARPQSHRTPPMGFDCLIVVDPAEPKGADDWANSANDEQPKG